MSLALFGFALWGVTPPAHAQIDEILEPVPTTPLAQSSGSFALMHVGGMESFAKIGLGGYITLDSTPSFLWMDQMNFEFGTTIDYWSSPGEYQIGGVPGFRFHFGSPDSLAATSINLGYYLAIPFTRATADGEYASGDLVHGFAGGLSMHFHLQRSWYFTVGFLSYFSDNGGLDNTEAFLGWQKRF